MPPIVFENCSTALSLGGLRRRIEALLSWTVVDVRLVLDRAAERDRQRKGGEQGRERAWPR